MTNAPYGYRVHPERPRDPALVEIDQAAAAVVRELFHAYADGEATLHALAVRLTVRGIASPTGRRFWSATSVRATSFRRPDLFAQFGLPDHLEP
jgi:site-specific DNA recombinase